MENELRKKPRILCLHGFRASGKITKEELKRWPEYVLDMMDLVCIDAPFPAEGKSALEGLFDSPYYEWYQVDETGTVFKNFDECIAYIEGQMIKLGPFDGVLGLSQPLYQECKERVLHSTSIPRIKLVILISAAKCGGSSMPCAELAKNAFSSPIDIPSLHMIGEKDTSKNLYFETSELIVCTSTPLYHHEGHNVPHLDNNGVNILLGFLNKIQGILSEKETICNGTSKLCGLYLDFVTLFFCSGRKKGPQ